ncbi:MAG TPA: Crp/Fnr family transcriptional regulator [Caulobacteraceae bacterium]|nr:Crp/Fnr family transcriptional regulator [Caulobacteraceae bacterium]
MGSPGNMVLRAVEPANWRRYGPRFERVKLTKSQSLQETGDEVEWVYFPETGLIGLAAETSGGESAQCTTVGRDGAVGVFEACGSRRAFYRAIVQVPGEAWRVRAGAYRELFDQSPGLRTAVHKLVEVLLAESRQYVACNALHSLQSRLARLLVDVQEKAACGLSLPLTQDALAQMLGVQRTSVALAIASLEKNGVLRRSRGAVGIVDRTALEREACSCWGSLTFAREEIYASFESSCDP